MGKTHFQTLVMQMKFLVKIFMEGFIMNKYLNDVTEQFSGDDISENKNMSLFAYFHILVFITITTSAKKSEFAKFHANQGLALFMCSICSEILCKILLIAVGGFGIGFIINLIFGLVDIVFLVATVYGVYTVYKGKAVEMPIIGKIKFLK